MDSRLDTYRHIQTVQGFMKRAIVDLQERQHVHDQSKLASPEVEVFDEYTDKLATSTYGSEEYKSFLAGMKPALDHHYAANSHHPEHTKLWKCPLCAGVFDHEAAPESHCYEEKPRFCPTCCPHGSMFEAVLDPYVGLHGMTLLDLVEMLCDWKAATLRHNNGDIRRSIEQNQKRFGYSNEMKQIFLNTLPAIEGVG